MRKSPTLTSEQRQARRDLIRRTKPWLRSTGPTTPEGKAKAAQRWRRHGMRGAEIKTVRCWIASLLKLVEVLRFQGGVTPSE